MFAFLFVYVALLHLIITSLSRHVSGALVMQDGNVVRRKHFLY